jgi:hypothetical protein
MRPARTKEVAMARSITGLWKIIQTNAEVVVSVSSQPDGAFTLSALQIGNDVSGGGGGHLNGDFVSFVINWNNNTAGAYNGAFDQAGRINGSTFDLKNPGSVAGWHSDRTF